MAIAPLLLIMWKNTTESTIAENGEGLDELHSTFEQVYRVVAKADDWLREILAAYYESQFRSSASDHPPTKESEGVVAGIV